MEIHHRIDDSNLRHTRFTTFIDGANCGQLCMLTKDVPAWFMIVRHGASLHGPKALDTYVETGTFWSDKCKPSPPLASEVSVD